MSKDHIELTMKGKEPFRVTKDMVIGITPDPAGTKWTMIWPYRILVKETQQQIIDKLKELS